MPLFTLFGPDALRARLEDSRARVLLAGGDADPMIDTFPGLEVLRVDARLLARLADEAPSYHVDTAPDDLALLQYTSGTTRALPEGISHTHRAVVTLMIAALYGVGLEPGDRYFCPSSPAWGHGLAHGTLSPLALGIAVGAYSGRFDASRLREALTAFRITNLAAAPTVYRLLRDSGLTDRTGLHLTKATYTGEPMDATTWDWIEQALGLTPCGMYGSTEVGVIVVNYPGFDGYQVRRGALGRAAPGWEVGIVDAATRQPVPAGEPGEIAVRRKGEWFLVKDRGWMDAEGYIRPRRPLGRRHHLGGLDAQRARDRASAPGASGGAGGRGHRRPRRAPRSCPAGLDRRAPRRRRAGRRTAGARTRPSGAPRISATGSLRRRVASHARRQGRPPRASHP